MSRSRSTSGSNKPAPANRSGKDRPATPPKMTWDEKLIDILIPWTVEIGGGLLFLTAVTTLLSLLGVAESRLLGWFAHLLQQLAGWGSAILALSLALIGVHVMLRRLQRPYQISAGQILGFELLLLAALPITHLLLDANLTVAYQGQAGGLIGWALSEPLWDLFGPILTGLFYLLLSLWGVALLFQVSWYDVISWLRHLAVELRELAVQVALPPRSERRSRPSGAPTRTAPTAVAPPLAAPTVTHDPADELIIIEDTAVAGSDPVSRRDRRLPPLRLLEIGSPFVLTKEEIDAKKQVIEQCLLDFGLPATVTEIRRGPAVTQFGVLPGYIDRPGPDGVIKPQKVRVAQIAALQKDLAMVLEAPRLRVEAPVPGRGIVGIEAPNSQISVVRLRALIESETFQKISSPLAVALGSDVTGAPAVTDLAKLPHLLIAGTTGSGKSVCLNALIACLVFNNTPEQLKLVMIDPKRVELVRFNGLPHLLGRVEVEIDRVLGVLRWLTAEMDRRYEMFATVGAKQLADYNRKIGRFKDQPVAKLPHIVVFIDELADLMASYGADVERMLCRLAQMARATGMHLVVATQRPSTDVITGLIKANFPARASFAVASGIDSRVILDTVGAEQLLGKGDMLFLSPDASAPARVQGCFVNDHEIEGIVNHWQRVAATATATAAGPEAAPWESLIARQALIDEKDDMLEQAVALAQKQANLSTSYLQRRLRIGYPRAARLMEALYEMGMVEDPKEGGRTRQSYVSEDDDPLGDYLDSRE
jgi:DNA segregation ATPase FtsK/SpoIIIE, S-DNA-T family